jgi:hypothetical protein
LGHTFVECNTKFFIIAKNIFPASRRDAPESPESKKEEEDVWRQLGTTEGKAEKGREATRDLPPPRVGRIAELATI